MEDIKHEKGTVTVNQTVFTSYKLGEKTTLMHRTMNGGGESFDISPSLERTDLYALKAVIEKILSQEPDKK